MATTPLTPATNGHPGGYRHDRADRSRETGIENGQAKAPRSRAGATWVGICIAALVLVALIVFMLQNTQPVVVSFLGMQGSVPLALALLIAGVGVGVVALVVGTVRISQLRRRLSRTTA
ncbi:lipopolysaccharide assembly protein LapA domain-containing protein [Cellulosimicrobium sp. Marseille-Q4280]|jgi:putative membrane protein|uniref:LapA family protein n=1 Tax=Cellulosimicrobium sp. Marseille-Q4280 TaxID=2937992 RepID=UPI00203D8E55|nr:lipopolysaccharide assembly protein LapA domain-containing protein [Cellulosimicrobium sp. Marseille-Q4280]